MILDKLNRPVRDLRISVTDKCNFRCHYCMPEDIFGHKYEFLAKNKILTFEEIARLTRIFTRIGVRKIRLTGGEPLLRQDLPVLVEMLANLDDIEEIALTTNAYFLERYARQLMKAGLDRITISLDTLDPGTFRKSAGNTLEIPNVLAGIDAAVQAGFSPLKLNTVIQKNVNDNEIIDLVRYAADNGHIIRFIEYMDVGNLNGWRMDDVVPAKEIISIISKEFKIEPIPKNYLSEVANRYRLPDVDGEFGIIASVTQPFCGNCSRVRLSADGNIYTCLFGTEGVNIKTKLRGDFTDKQIEDEIVKIWQNRSDRYSEARKYLKPNDDKKVEMYQIGG